MIKINYPLDAKDKEEMEKAYFNLFENRISDYVRAVDNLKNNTSALKYEKLNKFLELYPIKTIITGDIETLVNIFIEFNALDNDIKSKLLPIFSYSQTVISDFFEKYNHVFNLRACYYCNMDSVHAYSILGEYDTILDFIRFASKEELKKTIKISAQNVDKIIRIPNRDSLTLGNISGASRIAYEKYQDTIGDGCMDKLDFINNASKNELLSISGIGPIKADEIITGRTYDTGTLNAADYRVVKIAYDMLSKNTKNGITKNHFTLDHFIPQTKCGLLAISLYNFVPSCYVCNSKLKGTELLSKKEDLLYKFSPTYKKYESTGNLQFSLVQKSTLNIFDYSGCDKKTFLQNFEIDIEASDSNNRIVPVLYLKQRYSLYKEKAVKLAYLKDRYSDKTVEEIARILSATTNMTITKDEIKNDIFHYPDDENESFSKFHRDIQKQVGIKNKSNP